MYSVKKILKQQKMSLPVIVRKKQLLKPYPLLHFKNSCFRPNCCWLTSCMYFKKQSYQKLSSLKWIHPFHILWILLYASAGLIHRTKCAAQKNIKCSPEAHLKRMDATPNMPTFKWQTSRLLLTFHWCEILANQKCGKCPRYHTITSIPPYYTALFLWNLLDWIHQIRKTGERAIRNNINQQPWLWLDV